MEIIVDRKEGDFLVVELPSGQTVSVPDILLPEAEEGDVFVIQKDVAETDLRRQRISEKMNRLFVD